MRITLALLVLLAACTFDESTDTLETAAPIVVGETVHAWLSPGDVDHYELDAVGPFVVELRFADGQPLIYLLDYNGQSIAIAPFPDEQDRTVRRLEWSSSCGERLYLRVQDTPDGRFDGEYTLAITPAGAPAPHRPSAR